MEKKGLPALPPNYVWRSGNIIDQENGITEKFGGVRYQYGRIFWIEERLFYVRSSSRRGMHTGWYHTELERFPEDFNFSNDNTGKVENKSHTISDIEREEYEAEEGF